MISYQKVKDSISTSKVKKKSKKYEDWLIKLLSNYYKCSKLQVTEYLELIDKQELKTILEMYGTDKKQIKKVCR